MEKISRKEHARLLRSEVYAVVPVKAYLTVRRRNAWHSTTSSKYRSDAALFATLRDAEFAAELWRGRGSWFVIEEHPAIALITREGAVVCADINALNPFGHWDTVVGQRRIAPGVMLDDAITAVGVNGTWLREVDANSIIHAVDGLEGNLGPETVTSGTVFAEHESNVDGQGRQRDQDSLSWTERPHKIDASGVLTITSAVQELAGGASFAVALNQYVEERDAYKAAAAALREAAYLREAADRNRTEANRLRSEATAANASGDVEAAEELEWEVDYYEEMAADEEQELADAEAAALAAAATLEAMRPDLTNRLLNPETSNEIEVPLEEVPDGHVAVTIAGVRHVVKKSDYTITVDGKTYTTDTGRRIDLNQGGLIDFDIPDDREIVGGFVILRDEEGRFSTYVSGAGSFSVEARMPEPEVTLELGAHIAQAWELANL